VAESIAESLKQASAGPAGLLLSLLLGAASAVASSCCTLPAMGILLGYSAAREDRGRAAAVRSAAGFTAGTVLSLLILGGLAAGVGRSAQALLGQLFKPVAGIAAVVLGLSVLELLPFDLSPRFPGNAFAPSGKLGPAAGGLVLGGGLAACSLPCNPGIFIVLGAAVLAGHILKAALLLAMFAIGFSLPLGALLFGLSLGRDALPRGTERAIRRASGVLLLAAGFYLLVTF
jgi:cytochrome c biogenesis protein CcdA